ncbi:glycoside hydrolase domain-containing protein [Streptomyces sp. NPDC086554]|uniref:glycoside hydrolase domain-containing protein n=1 Tax=Streptomyces sp. NPDC086554 TaxID=3154864 RepID=UPI00343315A7
MRCRKAIMGLVLALALTTLALCAVPTGAAGRADGRSGGRSAGVSTFHGWAFDTCYAPPVGTMRRWLKSDYQAVGVYFGGRGRACKRQPHLSLDWMRAVRGMGWRVLPLYVGSQSPCVIAKNKWGVRIGRHAWRQGTGEGRDAVRRAKALGMRRGSPLYLDMEVYGYRNEKCARTTLAFVRAWDREVRRQGYVPGFYSSADSGVRHIETARRAGVRDLPAVMWFARWHTRPHLYRERVLRRDARRPAWRIHQFAGNVKERHGGRSLVIDRNLVHAPVARIR